MLQCIRRLHSDQDGESFQGRIAAVQLSAPLSAAQPAEVKRVAAHETTTLAITAHIRWVEVSGNSALQLKANSEQAQGVLLRLVRRGCKAQRHCELTDKPVPTALCTAALDTRHLGHVYVRHIQRLQTAEAKLQKRRYTLSGTLMLHRTMC